MKRVILVLGVASLVALVIALLLVAWGAILVGGDQPVEADALVMLSGGDDSRIAQSVELFQSGFVGAFVITETGELLEGSEKDHTSLVHRQLIDAGIPSDSIFITPQAADSTLSEAERVREMMEQRGFHSVLVVTDPYHTRRTELIYRQVLADSGLTARVIPAEQHWYRPATWWLKPEGWKVTLLETAKLAGFVLGWRAE